MWYGEFYPKSRPKAVAGGIKAQSQAGAIGKSWWAKRWVAVLEGFHLGNRLQRGRAYARRGQVLDIDIAAGRVTAKVQGSAPKPYSVSIEVRRLAAKDWDRLIGELNSQAVFAAKLLAGEMPADIEQVFERAGLSLFPKSLSEITTECSCPDWSNPCKHVAAVYYLIGEEFDRDPFLLFRLRGIDRDALRARLTAHAEPAPAAPPMAATAAPEPAAEPLPADPAGFWAVGPLPADLYGDVRLPPVSAAGPRRLGGFPFWRGGERFLDAMTAAYAAAARRGLAAFESESAGAESPATSAAASVKD